MKTTGIILVCGVIGLLASTARAVDVAGQWRAEFDTQIGVQNFIEMLEFQGNEIRIRYTGQVGTNEIAFTREVGDFAKEEFKATRVAVAATNAPAQALTNTAARTPQEPRIPRGRGVVLGPDDKPAFDDPPAGITAKREGIPLGKLEMVEYDSKTVGTKRKMQVYTPPGYTADKKYPVLYLLHGIGGDETEWERFAQPDVLLRISQGMHTYLKENNVPHIWHVDGNGHDATHWRNNLWLFSQRIFK